MLEQTDPQTPNYVTCCCQHCDGRIEFDANQLVEENSIVPCPHCGWETKVCVPTPETAKKEAVSIKEPTVRREGFFCGDTEAEQKLLQTVHPSSTAPNFAIGQIKSIGDAPTNDQTSSSKKRRTVVLTKTQCDSPLAKELISIIVEIEMEGFETDAGVCRLNKWLKTNKDSDIPAVVFLLETTQEFLDCGGLTPENASKIQNAIVRVLPRHIQTKEINSQEFSERLPARKSKLKRIRALGGNPPAGITRVEAHALIKDLQNRSSKKQIEYIRELGGNPAPNLTKWEASELINNLLSAIPATSKQMEFIRSLGGKPPISISRTEASQIIEKLLAERTKTSDEQVPPTPRQIMVLRFWNRLDMMHSSKRGVEIWLTQFYEENPCRKEAWEQFKNDYGDDGSQHDPSFVPIGIGESYLEI